MYEYAPHLSWKGDSHFSLNLAMRHPDVFCATYATCPGLMADGGLAEGLGCGLSERLRQSLLPAARRVRYIDGHPQMDGSKKDNEIVKTRESGFGDRNGSPIRRWRPSSATPLRRITNTAVEASAAQRLCMLMLLLLPAVLGAAALCHHLVLRLEKKKLIRLGNPVVIAGHTMNVLTEGPSNGSTIVLLSGSGVAAPVYEYRALYSKLTADHRVAVIEKFGYGYADVSGLPRDTATLVSQDREALQALGISGPYVLMAHSMSALEALYWADRFPGEVRAIVGLDMAVPHSYTHSNIRKITFFRVMTFFGLHRIPSFTPVTCLGLTTAQQDQNRLLTSRNTLNADVYEECRMVMANARTVAKLPPPTVPVLMFTTNLAGAKGNEGWGGSQNEFAQQAANCHQIRMKCGHNLHAEIPDYLAQEIQAFLRNLP